jgi:thiol:disulfide interchange protein DsbC
MVLALCASAAFAWEAKTPEATANLRKNYPGTKFDSVKPTEMEGIYEVKAGKNTLYTDVHGRVFIFGEMYDPYSLVAGGKLEGDVVKKLDLNSPAAPREKIEWSKLPLEDAIKVVKGDGSRKIAVFDDPDCPFCRKLNKELDGIDNVTIYHIPYPIAHPKAKAKIDAAWCAENRATAWKLLTEGYVVPSNGDCPSSPVERNLQLGRRFGILGTPFTVSENGKVAEGWVPRNEIERILK